MLGHNSFGSEYHDKEEIDNEYQEPIIQDLDPIMKVDTRDVKVFAHVMVLSFKEVTDDNEVSLNSSVSSKSAEKEVKRNYQARQLSKYRLQLVTLSKLGSFKINPVPKWFKKDKDWEHIRWGNYEYKGEVDKNGEPSGFGIFHWPNGDVYEGYFLCHKREGRGRMLFADGTIYDGDWEDDLMHGKGKYFWH